MQILIYTVAENFNYKFNTKEPRYIAANLGSYSTQEEIMNKIHIFLLAILGASLSANVHAYNLSYEVSLMTDSVEDVSAFGGTTIGDEFSGFFSIKTQELGQTVFDFGDTTVIDPIQLAYSFIIGDHNFSYAYDENRDYIADPDFGLGLTSFEVDGISHPGNFEVTGILSFIFQQSGDADSYELDIDSSFGTWSAYDDSTGYVISGSSSISAISAVPAPATIWLLGVAFLAGLARKSRHLPGT